jgi:hypothetical protein
MTDPSSRRSDYAVHN